MKRLYIKLAVLLLILATQPFYIFYTVRNDLAKNYINNYSDCMDKKDYINGRSNLDCAYYILTNMWSFKTKP